MKRPKYQDKTQLVPFEGASDFEFRLARSFALVTDWMAALVGQHELEDVVTALCRQVSAAHTSLQRITHSGKVSPFMAVSRLANPMSERMTGSLSHHVLSHRRAEVTPGSIWRLSDVRQDETFADTTAGREWLARTDIVDVSVVVMGVEDDHIDVIEFIFEEYPKRSPELPTSIITKAMSDAWLLRSPGIVLRLIEEFGRRHSRADHTDEDHIFAPTNPYVLSRSELRVAQLLSTGQKAKDIATALNLSVATVRTHLRNLYTKTGVSGQVELLLLINRDDPAQEAAE